MIGWAAIIGVAVIAFAAGALLLRGQRGMWTLLAAVLVFGLAGYAWQGRPDYASAPAVSKDDAPRSGDGLVDARRAFFDPANVPSRFVIVADAFARKGDFQQASSMLGRVVADNPNDGEAWLALHAALMEHSGGRITEPAEYALNRARETLKDNAGPAFFAGVNALRVNDFPQARELWAQALEDADEDTPGRDYLAQRLAGLDSLLAAVLARQTEMQAQSEPSQGDQAPE